MNHKSIIRKVDEKKTKQVVIDAELVRRLKVKASQENTTIKSLVEGCISELLNIAENK